MIGFFLTVSLILAAAWTMYFFWARSIETEIREGAGEEWTRLKVVEPALVEGLDEAHFTALYRRTMFPRFPIYALATATTFVAVLPVGLAALTGLVWAGQEVGLLPGPAEIARLVPVGKTEAAPEGFCDADCQLYVAGNFAGFYFFFGLLVIWLAVIGVVMRRFHARRPGLLRDEILRARAEPGGASPT